MEPTPHDIDDLLTHEPFVRGLARKLVHDGARADDVVQQTWLTALGEDRSRVASMRGWLATIVRRIAATARRSESRRERREREVARSELDASAADARLCEDARRRLVDAVFALDEPWRTTLILRYLDGIPQRTIAERMNVPVETVHSRLRRGIDLLRTRLDARHDGDRRAWLLGLIPFAARPGTVPLGFITVAAAHGVIAMLMHVKLVLGIAAAAAIGLLWIALDDPTPIAPTTPPASRASRSLPDPSSSEGSAAQDTTGTVRVAAPGELARRPPTAASDSTTGAIEVGILLPSPAPDPPIVVQVIPAVANLTRPERMPTVAGSARFDALPPGAYTVTTDRFTSAACVVEAGRVTRVELDATRGFRVEGRVVEPDGTAVAGAVIAISRFGQWEQGFDVATSDARGAFAVDGIAIGVHIGASKRGFAPSALHFVFGGNGEGRTDVVLRLRVAGGALAGSVADAGGSPIAGARIVVDADGARYETTSAGAPQMDRFERFAWSAADGAFDVQDLCAGEHDITVRAPGFAPFTTTVATSAAETTRVDARLTPGAIVRGVVRDTQGDPVAGVVVSAAPSGGFSESSSSASGSDGSFLLDSLPSGMLTLFADDARKGRARVSHEAVVGVESVVDLRLAFGPSVAGRVEDDEGRPLAGVRVDALDPAYGTAIASATTTEDGAFRVATETSESVDLDLHWAQSMVQPALRVRAVRVGADDLILRLPMRTRPSARIIGRLVDVDGPVTGCEVLIHIIEGPQATAVISGADGAFTSPLLSPGRYVASIRSTSHAVQTTTPIALEVGATHDLGTIRLSEGGSLRVHLIPPLQAPDLRPTVWLERANDGDAVFVHVADDVASATRVEPGTYVLSVTDGGVLARAVTFDVHDGEETKLELALEVAPVVALLRIDVPSIDAATVHLRIDDASGRTIHAGHAFRERRDRPFAQRVGLRPGRHRITIEAANGTTATHEFDVPENVDETTIDLSFP